MIELLRSNDPVVISFAEALLKDGGVEHQVVDRNMSIMEGSIGILPRRVLVASDQHEAARRILAAAGLGAELS
jgi:Putative prokaryotic signal transducing protein